MCNKILNHNSTVEKLLKQISSASSAILKSIPITCHDLIVFDSLGLVGFRDDYYYQYNSDIFDNSTQAERLAFLVSQMDSPISKKDLDIFAAFFEFSQEEKEILVCAGCCQEQYDEWLSEERRNDIY
jgi:hypothetical protein